MRLKRLLLIALLSLVVLWPRPNFGQGRASVTLRWVSNGGECFRVYRSGLVLANCVQATTFVDASVQPGNVYRYSVSALYENGTAETPRSEEVSAVIPGNGAGGC